MRFTQHIIFEDGVSAEMVGDKSITIIIMNIFLQLEIICKVHSRIPLYCTSNTNIVKVVLQKGTQIKIPVIKFSNAPSSTSQLCVRMERKSTLFQRKQIYTTEWRMAGRNAKQKCGMTA